MALSQQDEKDLYDPAVSFKRLQQKLQLQDLMSREKEIKSHPQGFAYLMRTALAEMERKEEEKRALALQRAVAANPSPHLRPPTDAPTATPPAAPPPVDPATSSPGAGAGGVGSFLEGLFKTASNRGGGDMPNPDERLPQNPLSEYVANLRSTGNEPPPPSRRAYAPASSTDEPRPVQRRPEPQEAEQPPSDEGGFEGPLTADQMRATQIAAAEAPEGERGAVMNVMLERMKRSGRGLRDVIDQDRAFEAASNGSYRRFQPGTAPYNRAEAETRQSIASGGTTGPGAGMTNFWSPPTQERLGRAPPKWAGRLEAQGVPQEQVGNQRFYNDPNWRMPGGNRPGAAGDRPVAQPPSQGPREDEVWPQPPPGGFAPPAAREPPPNMVPPRMGAEGFDPRPMQNQREQMQGTPGYMQAPIRRFPALPPGANMAPTPGAPPPQGPRPPGPGMGPMQAPDPAMRPPGPQGMLPPPRMGMPGPGGMMPPPMQMAGGPGGPESPFEQMSGYAPTTPGGSPPTSPLQTGLPPELQPRADVLPLSGPGMHARVDQGVTQLPPPPGAPGAPAGPPGGPAGAMPPAGVPMPPPRPQGPPGGALPGPGGLPLQAELSAQARPRAAAPPAPAPAPAPARPPASQRPALVPTITPSGDVAELPPLGLPTPPKAILDYARKDWNSGHPLLMKRAQETMEPYNKPLKWDWKDIDGRLHAVHPETGKTYPVGPTGITPTGPNGEKIEPFPGGVHESTAQKKAAEEVGKAAGARTAPMTPDEVLKYRADIRGLKSYLKYSGAKSVYSSMYDTAHQNDKASDLNLVYGMATLLDPESVVRGTEEQGVRNTASLPEWLKGYANMLAQEGSALTPQTREHLLREAHTRMNNYYKEFNSDMDVYRRVETRRKGETGEIVGGDIEPPMKWIPPGETERRAAAEELHRRAFEKEQERREKVRRGEHR